MMYISRRFGADGWGVVDTDDDVEEVIDFPCLNTACGKYNLDIKGCELLKHQGQNVVYAISQYQHPDYVTPEIVKVKHMTGIDIMLWHDMIVKVNWPELQGNPVNLRLSKFGKSIADYAFSGVGFRGRHMVTVVLDDDINFGYDSLSVTPPFFISVEGIGAKWDIREVTHYGKAAVIYKHLMEIRNGIDPFNSVIDIDARVAEMREHYAKRMG